MAIAEQKNLLKEFQTIPGVGTSLARDFVDLGFSSVAELKNRDPEKIYRELSALRGKHVDRCVLYVFRCAVYYASNTVHKPELLKWWNWKDREKPQSNIAATQPR
ncbi:MAG: helix-hairpin-helix domain-containing protein [Actinomycetota bacterium]|nr:helix-hairpin-helix domain-containing protein [Actinomycetota bacterium]